jgi:hypothetical protein
MDEGRRKGGREEGRKKEGRKEGKGGKKLTHSFTHPLHETGHP